MGWFDDVVDFVEDTASDVADTASDVVETVVETVTEVVENVEQATTDPVGWFGGVVEGVVDTVEDIADDPGGWFADTVDEYVFDTVDFVTAGAVNVDYEDGTFSASAGIDGVASYGVSVGEDGFEMSGEFDVGIASGEVSLGDEGFTGSASAGVDWGPLPYAEGHVEVSENGDISVGGQVQGTIPTPYGIVSGSAEGGFYRNEDGSWGANVAADGSIITPAGVTVGANVGVDYDEAADGDSTLNVSAGASVGYVGGPEVSAGVDYTHSDIDGVTTDSIQGEVGVEGYGLEASASGGYERVEDADGNVSETVTGEVEGSGYGVEVNASGEYERLEDNQGNVSESYSGEVGASGYGVDVGAGGEYTETTLADGTTTSTSDAWADVDGLDTDRLLSLADEALGTGGAIAGAGAAVGQVQGVADTVSDLAATGDLSDVFSTMADEGGGSIADVAGDLVESGNFDDFQSDVIESEVTEAAADEVWDDLGS
ncbi:MAG: hypothetical protein ACH37H_10565 [Ilumatobacteraceae bacterium]